MKLLTVVLIGLTVWGGCTAGNQDAIEIKKVLLVDVCKSRVLTQHVFLDESKSDIEGIAEAVNQYLSKRPLMIASRSDDMIVSDGWYRSISTGKKGVLVKTDLLKVKNADALVGVEMKSGPGMFEYYEYLLGRRKDGWHILSARFVCAS